MGLSLNRVVKPQSNELNKRAILFSSNHSPVKRLYVEGEKPNFSKDDLGYLIKNMKRIYKLPHSLLRAVDLIKKDTTYKNDQLDQKTFDQLNVLLEKLGVDDYGFFEVTPDKIFRGNGVPHKYALVFSSGMDRAEFETAPSIRCQLEVAKVYLDTGNVANRVAEFLQKKMDPVTGSRWSIRTLKI